MKHFFSVYTLLSEKQQLGPSRSFWKCSELQGERERKWQTRETLAKGYLVYTPSGDPSYTPLQGIPRIHPCTEINGKEKDATTINITGLHILLTLYYEGLFLPSWIQTLLLTPLNILLNNKPGYLLLISKSVGKVFVSLELGCMYLSIKMSVPCTSICLR